MPRETKCDHPNCDGGPCRQLTSEELLPDLEDLELAMELVRQGYYQVSRRHRIVARLPEGMTGIEALKQVDHPRNPEWAEGLGEGAAGDHWLRCYAQKADLWKQLSVRVFNAFRQVGGGTYNQIHYERTK